MTKTIRDEADTTADAILEALTYEGSVSQESLYAAAKTLDAVAREGAVNAGRLRQLADILRHVLLGPKP